MEKEVTKGCSGMQWCVVRSFALASLFCAGCSLAPEYERPKVELPSEYSDSIVAGESIALASWTDVYKDPNLKELIREALQNNRDLAVSTARIEEARAILGFVRADQFPGVNLGGDGQRGDLGAGFIPRNSFSLFGALSYELDLWGKLRNATDAQRAALMSSTYTHQAFSLALVADVANLYFALLDLDRRIEISERTLRNRAEATQIIDARLKKGIVPGLDLNQAQFEEADVAANLEKIRRARRTTENAILVLVGRSSGGVRRAPASLSDTIRSSLPTGVPADLLVRRPDLLSLEEQIRAELYQEGVAWAERLPSVDLLGSIGFSANTASDLFDSNSRSWSVGGSLFSPLLDWGKNRSRVEAQQARVLQAKARYEGAVLNALREVQDALIDAQTYLAENEQRLKQIAASKNATKLSRARYNDGVTTYLEVLDVERSLYGAELDASDTYRQYLSALTRLYKSLGGGAKASA